MFITADQILVHLLGDYFLQSDWMASFKQKNALAAFCHAFTYSLCFLVFKPSLLAWVFILATHFAIDHWRLARYLCWVKNFLGPVRPLTWEVPDENNYIYAGHNKIQMTKSVTENLRNYSWELCQATGYGPDKPVWLTVWLLIITDNTMHLICNGIALKWL